MTNYRPISLLAVFSKVIEKVMHSILSQHLCTYNILGQNCMVLGKGYQLKMLPSDWQIVYSNLIIKVCMLEDFSVI